jgi:pSer/pThr/pTyr-binding forkhead associated (FHA) protein
MSVSKRHCQLNCDGGALNIRDLGSRNGTYLNGKRINEAVIKAGDAIEIGPLTFIFQIDGHPETIVPPDWVTETPPPQDIPAKDTADMPIDDTADTADEQLDDFAELEDLESLDDLDS